jgi:hypothetical protein
VGMMSSKPIIVEVNSENLSQYPPACFLNPKNVGCQIKLDWLKERFVEGLKIKLLYFANDKKCHGFIEYVPGEHAWLKAFLLDSYLKSFDEVIVQDDDDYFDFDDNYL